MKFDDWAFEQCVLKGHTIVGIKNNQGVNINFKNLTTGELFHKDNENPQEAKNE